MVAKVTITSIDKHSYFDVNEYTFEFTREQYPSNKEQFDFAYECGKQATYDLSRNGHRYIEITGINLFDCRALIAGAKKLTPAIECSTL